jgi:hypothetical protein
VRALSEAGRSEQSGVALRCANIVVDHRHLPSLRRQESHADILEEMPAIRHLERSRQGARNRAAIATVTVAGNNLDLALPPWPCFYGRRLPARQQVHDLPPLEAPDHRAVELAAPSGSGLDTRHDTPPSQNPSPISRHSSDGKGTEGSWLDLGR